MKLVSLILLSLFSAFLLLPAKDSLKCPDGQKVIITIDGANIDISCKLKD